MKIGLTADLHFDEHASMSSMRPSGLTTRLEDCLACWRWIVKTCVDNKCDRLMVLGDVFASRTSIDLPVIHVVSDAFREAAEVIGLHIVTGNHDSYLRTPRINSTAMFKGVATVWDEARWATWPGGISLGIVPWTDDADLYAKNVKMVGERTYLFSHALLEGVTASGRGVPKAALRCDYFNRIFLGDVHDPKFIEPNIQYVGAPLQINYGDAGGKRGFFILDTGKNSVEFIENTISPRFHLLTDTKVDNVREGDFVRVKTEDVQEAAEIVAALQGKTEWIENEAVEIDDAAPRLDVRSKDQHDVVLQRYIDHMGVKMFDADELLELGLDILAEVK